MGKKNKNKFKKQIKAQLAQTMTQAQVQVTPKQKNEHETITPAVTSAPMISANTMALQPEYNLPQIKYDLKKTALVVLILAGVIAALYYLDFKYGILTQFGNWLFTALNIQ